ncbi:MAG: hypothetical protein LBK47_03800 [Prevotellaceae bacterium]|jgi:hypothetical protein|nr:hypothetical protein [Prevotellaceae bacterium]
MTGREDKAQDDLFFVCSLIEYIARKTKNHRNVVANAIGRERLGHLYELADVYHSENIDKISDELIARSGLDEGRFDNVAACRYAIPSFWDIGKVYKRLITEVAARQQKPPIEALVEVYGSWLSRKIEDFNCSMYYENPDYLYQSYVKGEAL